MRETKSERRNTALTYIYSTVGTWLVFYDLLIASSRDHEREGAICNGQSGIACEREATSAFLDT